MSLVIETQETPKGWTLAKCYGFKLSANEQHILALFELHTTKDSASYVFSNPLKLREINKLALAVGKPAFNTGAKIELPAMDDKDKLGWDTDILVSVISSGQYINIKDFKPGDNTKPGGTPF